MIIMHIQILKMIRQFYSGAKPFASSTLTFQVLDDYLIACSYDQSVVMKVRESCYKGSFNKSPLRAINPDAGSIPTDNYKDTQFRNLSADKFKLIYDQFVPPEWHPDYLPPVVINFAGSSSSSCNNTESLPTKKQ